MSWTTANKMAIVFGILGGVYLMYHLYNIYFSPKSKFTSEILIQEIKAPIIVRNYSFKDDLENIIPFYIDKRDLAQLITDSLYIDESWAFQFKFQLINLMPNGLNRLQLTYSLDSLINSIVAPFKGSSFIETSITNLGNNTANNLRFEIPTKGYYELFENNALRQNGYFTNIINVGELRIHNSNTIRIWSEYPISNYSVTDAKTIKYTFDDGLIYPKTTEVVISEGILFWIFKNPFSSLYFFIMFLWFAFLIISQFKKAK